ncbi:MAG: M20/M25/M40 family metallo-hydrolase [Gemmatimonadetes bacterium]|nr:M20/M25/M40 family metallo-hydrolase [Gemmatimonadota bacterium]
MRRASLVFALAATLVAPDLARSQATALTADQKEARDILREIVNINSTSGTLGVKKAAEAMRNRLLKPGYPAADVLLLGPKPELTAVVARLRGRNTGKKPILLMAHLDAVAANPKDWPFDPFTFQEKDGWYYGRGSDDDKSGVANIVANFVRWKREKWVPDRDIVAVLSADEETEGKSIAWLLEKHRDKIDAEYALNADGGGGALDKGKPLANTVQASEKTYVDFRVEVTNRGGHSSVPRADNAIYELAEALVAFGKYTFPVRLNEVSRAFFAQGAATQSAEVAALMRAAAKDDADAQAKLSAMNPYWNSVMRTTCVATMLDGGHADNALPQRAGALINCRMAPDDPTDSVMAVIQRVVGPKAKVTLAWKVVSSPVSPLRADVMGVFTKLTNERFPGATVIPEMSTGATDGLFTRNAGIPTYGVSAVFAEQGEPSRAHGQEERVGVKAFHEAVEFWYEMVKQLGTASLTP